MTVKTGLVIAGIAGVAALGTGGYFANEWRVCSKMKDDFLNSVDGFKSNVYLAALAGSVGAEVDRKRHKELQGLSLQIQEMQLAHIYERCGSDAGKAASDLASEELRDGMQDILSIP